MTIHVNIGEAKTRLSELVAAALRGEEVVLDRAGKPQVRLAPVEEADLADRRRDAQTRASALGIWQQAFADYDISIAALKADRSDPDERFRRKFGLPD